MDPKTKNGVSQFSKTGVHVGFENYQKSEKTNTEHYSCIQMFRRKKSEINS